MDQLQHLNEVFGPLAAICGVATALTAAFAYFVSRGAAAVCAVACVIALALYIVFPSDRTSHTIHSSLDLPNTAPTSTAQPSYSVAEPPAPAPPMAIAASFRDCDDVCPEMQPIPQGQFTMGSPLGEAGRYNNEGPQRNVTIAYGFAVGKYDVTFAEWDACAADGGCNGYRPDDHGWGRDRRPVIFVSWQDAQAYVAWLSQKTGKSYRLLSEAEWEYAARAGTTTAYYWSDGIGSGNADCTGCGGVWNGSQTAPVGSFRANAFGLYDMLGNAWQWLGDCYSENYDGAPADGSVWQAGDCNRRMLRGGSWNSEGKYARAAYRGRNRIDARFEDFGFRVARNL